MRAAKFLFFTFFCVFGSSQADIATDAFTGDLLKTIFSLKKTQENTVLSPVSLYDVTALLQQGSGGNSLDEITRVLHADAATTKQRYSQLVKQLRGPHSETQLEFANKVFLENKFKIETEFRRTATQDFQADIDNIEFARNVQAAGTINQWVSDNTHGKITDLVSSDSLSADTAMVLLNAVFFAGNWTYQFDSFGTKDSPFTTLEREVKDVPTMHLSEALVAGEIDGLDAKFVRLPFNGNEFSMIVVVPNEIDGLSAVIGQVQEDKLASILTYTERRHVDLKMPKFKFSTTSKLVPVLEQLGMHDIFSGASDLTGIAASPPLYVSDVMQKATIEVDEKGATAAAATSITIGRTATVVEPPVPMYIVADHPFVFFISDDINSVPLFSGWVVSP